ncbi:Methyltransferase domain-containing protein [Jatrophihabitans endophyticus]|uniref:Methyltransferase domain-containing protein n=1 Tax=Jatrophihabitans endophyticus TaxID=1206085 RepID=A0A1M5I4P8_9ACTN|nr:methyltransferase domain-containing protein [Jatrophihabitans endophyticus]SHG22823.1 Methyltransferase domain-containing protein [Jatrophihabitans endophyticus]
MSDRAVTTARVAAAVRRRVRTTRKRVARRLGGTPAPAPRGRRLPGLVEEFSNGRVAGWVAVDPQAAPVRIALRAGNRDIAAAWAADVLDDRHNWGEVRGFQLRLRDVWSYVSPRDKLTVRVNGKSLPIAGHGMYLVPKRKGRSNLAKLGVLLDSGHVFGQGGRLQLSKKLDTEWQDTVMGLYERVRQVLHRAYGYDVFFVYGTLLGAVREGSVIGHDVDFDCAFVSRHSEGPLAAAEMRDIGLLLVDEGFDVDCRRTALHLHDADDPKVRIDLFHLYFDENDRLAAPFGVAGTNVITRDEWTGMTEIDFCGGRGLVPSVAEKFAEHLYGASWRLPKPGFEWNRERTDRARAGILPFDYTTTVLWENAYAHRPAQAEPTSFFTAVTGRDDLPGTVVDIGSGDGRDTVAFAATGRRVLGLDRSPRGVALAAARADAGTAEFARCDIQDDAELRAALTTFLAATDGPTLFYFRFLVHAITTRAEQTLLHVLGEVSRPGDVVAAEFRTDLDTTLPKAFGNHVRRFVPAAAFDGRLTAAGFDTIDVTDGVGLAPFGKEDPQLHRVLARRR